MLLQVGQASCVDDHHTLAGVSAAGSHEMQQPMPSYVDNHGAFLRVTKSHKM